MPAQLPALTALVSKFHNHARSLHSLSPSRPPMPGENTGLRAARQQRRNFARNRHINRMAAAHQALIDHGAPMLAALLNAEHRLRAYDPTNTEAIKFMAHRIKIAMSQYATLEDHRAEHELQP